MKIRRPVLGDARFFADIENDSENKKFLAPPSGKSKEQCEEWIRTLPDDYRCLTIQAKAGDPIGRCGIITVGDEAEIHLILAKQYWGQGLGAEIALALTELARKKFPEKTLTAKVHPRNESALALVRKLGMSSTGKIESSGYDNGFLKFEKET